jgi:hypothetical protein
MESKDMQNYSNSLHGETFENFLPPAAMATPLPLV